MSDHDRHARLIRAHADMDAGRYEQAREVFDALAAMHDTDGLYYSASLRLKLGEVAGALERFVAAANAGHPSAAYWASAIHGGYGGMPPSPAEEARFLTMAANLGHMFAKRDLARRRMRQAPNPGEWLRAGADWLGIKAKMLGMIAKNVNDVRVR